MMKKLCRIQGEVKRINGERVDLYPTFIPWWLAEEAYKEYNCKSQQSLEEINRRGGFGREELLKLLRRERL